MLTRGSERREGVSESRRRFEVEGKRRRRTQENSRTLVSSASDAKTTFLFFFFCGGCSSEFLRLSALSIEVGGAEEPGPPFCDSAASKMLSMADDPREGAREEDAGADGAGDGADGAVGGFLANFSTLSSGFLVNCWLAADEGAALAGLDGGAALGLDVDDEASFDRLVLRAEAAAVDGTGRAVEALGLAVVVGLAPLVVAVDRDTPFVADIGLTLLLAPEAEVDGALAAVGGLGVVGLVKGGSWWAVETAATGDAGLAFLGGSRGAGVSAFRFLSSLAGFVGAAAGKEGGGERASVELRLQRAATAR